MFAKSKLINCVCLPFGAGQVVCSGFLQLFWKWHYEGCESKPKWARQHNNELKLTIKFKEEEEAVIQNISVWLWHENDLTYTHICLHIGCLHMIWQQLQMGVRKWFFLIRFSRKHYHTHSKCQRLASFTVAQNFQTENQQGDFEYQKLLFTQGEKYKKLTKTTPAKMACEPSSTVGRSGVWVFMYAVTTSSKVK